MPINRNAFIRYKIIDACLCRRQRHWTLEDLRHKCSEALIEQDGNHAEVSKRTIQHDIQLMRSDKFGFNAPIVVVNKKHYIYDDPDYSIMKIPLTQKELVTLNEVLSILNQFKGLAHFQEVEEIVNRLKHKIENWDIEQKSLIDFEKNERLKGLEHLKNLYSAINNQKVIKLVYQSFKAFEADEMIFHPHFLKEYRNRWFVLGLKGEIKYPYIFALDRIINFEHVEGQHFRFDSRLNASWFSDMIGVSKSEGQATKVIKFWVSADQTPYVMTKPFHTSQQCVEELENGSAVFSLEVIHNFELEREFLGFGHDIEILEPRSLRKRIADRLGWARDLYLD